VTGAICRNEEFLHPGLNGVYSVVTNSSSLIVSSNLYDQFGFLRNASGLANSLIRYGFNAEEGINNLRYLFTQVQTNQVRQQQQKKDDEHCERRYQRCKDAADKAYSGCLVFAATACYAAYEGAKSCLLTCTGSGPGYFGCVAGCWAAAAAICAAIIGACWLGYVAWRLYCDIYHRDCSKRRGEAVRWQLNPREAT